MTYVTNAGLLITVGSIFYFGWLIAEYPANAILQKLPVGKVVGVAVVMWGVLVMCLGAAQNAAGLMSLRFLMGALEAPLFPAVTILNTMWYKKSEQPVRMAWTFTAFSSVRYLCEHTSAWVGRVGIQADPLNFSL